jgi:hypothetical protein
MAWSDGGAYLTNRASGLRTVSESIRGFDRFNIIQDRSHVRFSGVAKQWLQVRLLPCFHYPASQLLTIVVAHKKGHPSSNDIGNQNIFLIAGSLL